jgi:hypothetical protein
VVKGKHIFYDVKGNAINGETLLKINVVLKSGEVLFPE